MDLNLMRDYPSNIVLSTGNNSILIFDKDTEITSRIFYKVRNLGKFSYKFFFNNALDSSTVKRAPAYANRPGSNLIIKNVFVKVYNGDPNPKLFDDSNMKQITFNGSTEFHATPNEFFYSDDIELDIKENDYLVFQWTIIGKEIPITLENMVPSYMLKDNEWKFIIDIPQPFLIGAKRKVDKIVTFLGDSITQGLQTINNDYEFWVAKIAEKIPKNIAIFNIGLGFAKAADAATNSHWLNKAKVADFINICLGVNDLNLDRTVEQIKHDLKFIILELKKNNIKVGIFTIPPFDFKGDLLNDWRECNEFINKELAPLCEYCLCTADYWGEEKPNDNLAKYGGHPNGVGCKLLADAFLKNIGNFS